MQCRLCLEMTSRDRIFGHGRDFSVCDSCGYVQVNPQQILSTEDEGKRYLLHENSSGDPRYEEYLRPIVDLVVSRTAISTLGIDIGSGKEKVLETLLFSKGRRVVSYDLYFHPEESLLKNSYDFLICSETLEHFRDPRRELQRFSFLVKKGGPLFFRTSFYHSNRKFTDWHYQRDPTHIGFFSEKTFFWMEKEFGWKMDLLIDPFVVMTV